MGGDNNRFLSNNLGPYKRALFHANTFPDAAAPGEISDRQVIDTMKGRILIRS